MCSAPNIEAEVAIGSDETIDDFLGGAVKLIQSRTGYRVSMDTVMLAASVPAKAGDRVIEAGVGTAGAALCLASRVGGVHIHGIDNNPAMLEAAKRNIAFNGQTDRISLEEACVTDHVGQAGTYDHAMINPPYLAAGKALRPPDQTKGSAHMEQTAELGGWVTYCLYHLKHKASLSIVYRADRLDELIAKLYRRVGDIKICPLWPRAGEPAKRVLVQGRKGTSGRLQMLPGLVLHGAIDRYTDEAQQVLRYGAALRLAG